MQPKTHLAIASQHYQMLNRQSRVASVSSHGLVSLLYEELLRSLDLIIAKHAHGRPIADNTHLAKALSIVVALECSLDFNKGGDLAPVLSRIYRSATRSLNEAARNDENGEIVDARAAVSDLAYAWQSITGSAAV